MSIRSIPRTAISGSIKVARLPLDLAVSLLPGDGDGDGPAAGASIMLDRAEAQVRDLAGAALGDRVLREDAVLRRIAADERARALELRAAARRRAEESDERLEETLEQADQRRAAAAERAGQQRATAAAKRNDEKQAAATAQRRRRASSAKVRAKTDEVIDEQAADARLEQLKRDAAALDEKAGALTAKAEAQRLQDEATKKKAARKRR